MVLQQGVYVPVWGSAEPEAVVRVRFVGREASAVADASGRWMAHLPPLEANALPAVLEVVTSAGDRLTVTDVLVGEVWLCSGQSNMQWTLANSNNGSEETAAADYPAIRLLTVPMRPSARPEEEIMKTGWRACSPETAANFSGVGYFFGRELHQRLNVPVGLINSSWGGSNAETWVSRESLLREPELRELLDAFERDLPALAERHAGWVREVALLEEKIRDRGIAKHAEGWSAVSDPSGDWADMELPATWQSRGCNHSGILWFRKAVDVPATWAGKDLRLSIGATDKSDITWFNGVQVGSVTMAQRLDAWSFRRCYTVPGACVKAGRNVIAVRVHSEKYAGGMTGPSEVMTLSCPDSEESAITLAGVWRYAIEANYGLVQLPAEPLNAGSFNAPCALFNGMIAPLVPYAMRGAIWYQGESNAGRAKQYETLFPALIHDWRHAWGQGGFAFYFVQLANYMVRKPQPVESGWAELRDAQRLTLALPETGMAVALDIGDGADIHPRNKQDVGRRLAFNALNQTYGYRDVTPCGPLFRSAVREGGAIRVSFDVVDGGLECRGDKLSGFAVAGADRRYVWADARIEGEQVVVSSPDVPQPVYVRYGWADNPEIGLYNPAGLPAAPFQWHAE
jgi:sialate O-acetylesterase